jgi:hypothetical protein
MHFQIFCPFGVQISSKALFCKALNPGHLVAGLLIFSTVSKPQLYLFGTTSVGFLAKRWSFRPCVNRCFKDGGASFRTPLSLGEAKCRTYVPGIRGERS